MRERAVIEAVRGTAAAWLNGLGRVLWPPHCVACGRPLGRWVTLCGACRAGLPLIGERCCPRCGRPVGPYASVGTTCPECRRLPLARVAAVAAAGTYEGPLREMVLFHKRRDRRDLAAALGDLVAAALARQPWAGAIDLIVPVPLHWRRRLGRGFNQAERLAAAVSRRLRRPAVLRALRRRRNTPSQVGLSLAARVRNVAGCMAVAPLAHVRGRTILLVDDVMTTGATLSECARVLRRAGAREVYAAVAAVRHGTPIAPDAEPADA